MPIIIICGILAICGIAGHKERDKQKTYTYTDMNNMLREMTGKSKAERRKIMKRYGRR